jgi:hypothetical protein
MCAYRFRFLAFFVLKRLFMPPDMIRPSALFAFFAIWLNVAVHGQTIINVPPSSSPTSVGANTIVNVLSSGRLNNLVASNGAIINIDGGSTSELTLRSGAIVNANSGGINSRMWAENGGKAIHRGGRTTSIFAYTSGLADVYGGAIEQLGAVSSSSLTLHGVDFLLNGVPIGGLNYQGDTVQLNLAQHDMLTGILSDGTAIGFYQGFGGQVATIADGTLTLKRSATPVAPAPGPINITTVSNLLAAGQGQALTIGTGGRLGEHFRAGPGSSVEINAGRIDAGYHAIDSTLVINGGHVARRLHAYNNSQVFVRGGTLEADAWFYRNSSLNIQGGEVGGGIRMQPGSTMNMSGGTIHEVEAFRGSTVNIDGGIVNHVMGSGLIRFTGGNVERIDITETNGLAEFSGGTFGDNMRIRVGAKATVYASEFRLNGNLIPGLVNPGDSVTIPIKPQAHDYLTRSDYLSGVFENGLPFVFGGAYEPFAESVKLVLTAPYAADPKLFQVPTDTVPKGLHSGQSLILSDGGSLPDNFTAGEGSSMQVTGGTVGRNLEAFGANIAFTAGQFNTLDAFAGTTVNIGGSTAWSGLNVYNDAVVNINGGTYSGGSFLQALPGSTINLAGGKLRGDLHGDTTTANISGGEHKGMQFEHFSNIEFNGGLVENGIKLLSGSSLTVRGGKIGGITLSLGDSALAGLATTIARIENGEIGTVTTHDESETDIFGGTIDRIYNASGITNVFGGALGDGLDASAGSLIFYGYDFQVDGVPIAGLANVGDSIGFNYTPGTFVSGTLADGTPFHINPSDYIYPTEINNGVIRFTRAALPSLPTNIQIPSDEAPHGISTGQSLVLSDGGTLGRNFIAGPGSTAEITGGRVGDNFEADRSQVIISGGTVGEGLDVFKGATVTVTGGVIGRDFDVHTGGVLNVQGGTMGMQGRSNGGTLNFSGGTLGSDFNAFTGSTVNISGGTVESEFTANMGSIINVTGGQIGTSFEAANGAVMNISGGGLRDLEVRSGGIANISGGNIDTTFVYNGGKAVVTGGSFGDNFGVSTTSTLSGINFKLNGVPIAGLDTPGGEVSFSAPSGSLFTGVLADGTPFSFENSSFNNLKLIRSADLPAPTPHVNVPSDLAPGGVRSGQTLTLHDGGALPKNFTAGEGSIVNVLGGSVGDNFEAYASVVNIDGGVFTANLDALAQSEIYFNGGQVALALRAWAGSKVEVTGGSLFRLNGESGSLMELSGGVVGDLDVRGGSQLIWNGGIATSVDVSTNGKLGVYGIDFRLNGIPIAGLGTEGNSLPYNIPANSILTGTLADGTPMILDPSSRGQAIIANGSLTLHQSADPGPLSPQQYIINSSSTLRSLGNGQSLILEPGGQVGLIAGSGSSIRIEGGELLGGFRAFGANIQIDAGMIGPYFTALAGTTLDIDGGVFGTGFELLTGSQTSISGGTFPQQVTVHSGAVVDILGKSFFINGVPISQLTDIGDSFVLSQFNGQLLTATLHDGSVINWRLNQDTYNPRNPNPGIYRGAAVTLHLVPEPTGLIIALAFGAIGSLTRRQVLSKNQLS